MKLLIVDPAGNGLDIAVRAMRHGHQVKMFIRQAEKTQHIGRGIVELVDDFKPWLRWADQMVVNASRCADDQTRPAAQLRQLLAHRRAANKQHAFHLRLMAEEKTDLFKHLPREFACRRHDQSGFIRIRHQISGERDTKGAGLAGACLRGAENIAAFKGQRNRAHLNWGGCYELQT
jgi:hypothetical protein